MKTTVSRTLAALVIGIAFSTQAFAEGYAYQKDQLEQQLCGNAGKFGEMNFLLKKMKRPKMVERDNWGYMRPIYLHAVDYGYNDATSQKDAHMGAWAYCMDNIEELALDAGR